MTHLRLVGPPRRYYQPVHQGIERLIPLELRGRHANWRVCDCRRCDWQRAAHDVIARRYAAEIHRYLFGARPHLRVVVDEPQGILALAGLTLGAGGFLTNAELHAMYAGLTRDRWHPHGSPAS